MAASPSAQRSPAVADSPAPAPAMADPLGPVPEMADPPVTAPPIKDPREEVRKSIVRISFDWMKKSKDKEVMVIAGIILSITDDGSAVIAANSKFFGMKSIFVVNFPNADGYEAEQTLDVLPRGPDEYLEGCKRHEYAKGFYIFTAKPIETGYIKAVRFETQTVQRGDPVDAFVFPRESYITPTGYRRGSVMTAGYSILQHDCEMHEYGYLGSPVFNLSGDLVGITYLNQGHWQAWTVWHLRDTFSNYISTIVFQGIEQPAGAEAQEHCEYHCAVPLADYWWEIA